MPYEGNSVVGVEAVVLSTQHDADIGYPLLREAVMEKIILPVLPAGWLDRYTQYHINPTGRFVIGGPVGDCGLTGRKIIVDTYGGSAHHGGGAFSGKDPSKVDRSAAYAGRYVAKNIVAAGLVRGHFDLRPHGLVKMLDLIRPIFHQTAAYSHFGREEPEFTWEHTDRAEALRDAAGGGGSAGGRTGRPVHGEDRVVIGPVNPRQALG